MTTQTRHEIFATVPCPRDHAPLTSWLERALVTAWPHGLPHALIRVRLGSSARHIDRIARRAVLCVTRQPGRFNAGVLYMLVFFAPVTLLAEENKRGYLMAQLRWMLCTSGCYLDCKS